MNEKMLSKSKDVLIDLAAALDRLRLECPIVMRSPYRINQSTVCKEAGRVRSTIKNTRRFAELKHDIKVASHEHSGKLEKRNRPAQNLVVQLDRLREQNEALKKSLDDAAQTIYRLYLQLRTMEDDRQYILDRVADARKVSASVDKQFRMLHFDELIQKQP